MKNLFYLCLIALLGTLAFAACGSSKTEPDPQSIEDSLASIAAQKTADSLRVADSLKAVAAEELKQSVDPANLLKLIDKMYREDVKDGDPLLAKMGMKVLEMSSETDEEDGIDYVTVICGRNASLKTSTFLEPIKEGEHAVVAKVVLATDNNEDIYFSDEEDFKAFKKYVENDEDLRYFWSFGKQKGWYVAYGHIG